MAAQICEFCKHEKEDCYCSPNSTCKDYEPCIQNLYVPEDKTTTSINIPKVVNGSKMSVGGKISTVEVKIDQHFNWFQKLMWKWCFGIKVESYNEE